MQKLIDFFIKKESDVQETRNVQQPAKQLKKLGKVRKKKGLTLFEYNTLTGIVTEAVYEPADTYNLKDSNSTRLVVSAHCQYAQSLNLKNAKRHFGV